MTRFFFFFNAPICLRWHICACNTLRVLRQAFTLISLEAQKSRSSTPSSNKPTVLFTLLILCPFSLHLNLPLHTTVSSVELKQHITQFVPFTQQLLD